MELGQFDSPLTDVSWNPDVGYFTVEIEGTNVRTGFGKTLGLTAEGRHYLGNSVDFGKDYGSLLLTVGAVHPKERLMALGIGPDVFIGRLWEADNFPDSTGRVGVYGIVSDYYRIGSVGFISQSEKTAIFDLRWNSDGTAILGLARRVNGTGWESGFLIKRTGDEWYVSLLPGQRFAWSPDSALIACEVDGPVTASSAVVILRTDDLAVVRRFEGAKLLGWLPVLSSAPSFHRARHEMLVR